MTSTLFTRPPGGDPHGSAGRRASRRSHAAALALATLAVALATGAADSAAAAAPTTLAGGPIDGLIQSTGNLYWTSHHLNEFGPSSASVYRASKFNTPGAERVLYRETGNGYLYFGDITYANVGTWYGYFVANYGGAGGLSQIKRVPLEGGQAVKLADSPAYVGLRELDTDGSFLYWADAGGLRRMPIGGGAVTTLVDDTNIGSVGLDWGRVYYSSGKEIRSVSKPSSDLPVVLLPRTHIVAQSNITSLYVHRRLTIPVSSPALYWGEQNASVKSAYAGGGGLAVHQGPSPGRRTWSVSFDGARVLWSDCAYPNGNGCLVRKRDGATTTVADSGGVGARNVQGDAGAMFWSDTALKKAAH